MAEHIDRARLDTELIYRFEYISKFLNFTKDDISVLNALAPMLFSYIPAVVETIYKKLNSLDITKKYFICDDDEFDTCTSNEDTKITITSSQSFLLKDTLSIYLKRILIQTDWNETFLQYLSEIGDLNIDHKHSKEMNSNYIHINALFCFMEHSMVEMILKAENLDTKKKRAGVRALNKVFWIQNSLFTMHHGIASKGNSVSTSCIGKKKHCYFK